MTRLHADRCPSRRRSLRGNGAASSLFWAVVEPHPMSAGEFDKKLFEVGCHPTDIGDAFYEADPVWAERA